MKVEVSISGIEPLVKAINVLAAAMAHPAQSSDAASKEITPELPKEQVTLEMVRAKLAALMQSGKQSEVKELLKKYGGDKLSDVPDDKYPVVLKEAEDL